MKKIEFEGLLSGDYECFCWDVTKEVFKEVTGKNPCKWDKSTFNKKLYKLYPGAVLEALGIQSNAKCKIKISGGTVKEGKALPITSHQDLISKL